MAPSGGDHRFCRAGVATARGAVGAVTGRAAHAFSWPGRELPALQSPPGMRYTPSEGGMSMNEEGRKLVEALHRRAAQDEQTRPSPAVEPPPIPWTELPEAKPGEVFYREWNTYRREVGHLLAEGQAGRYVLIKGEQIIGT